MKKLQQYILEALILEGVNAEEILKKLSNSKTLPDYVDKLNKMLKDPDCEAILNKAFGEYSNKDGYDFDGEDMDIIVNKLHPTQNEIDVDKSLGYPFKDTEKAEVNMKKFYAKDSPVVEMPFPLITFGKEDEKYIIDGHHRWSQVFSFNPNAKMKCFNLTVKDGPEKLTANDVLKICQGFIAARAAKNKKKELGSSKAGEVNALVDSKDKILAKVASYCDKNPEPAEIIRKAISEYYDKREKQYAGVMKNANVDDEHQKTIKDSLAKEKDYDGLAAYLTADLLVLQNLNKEYVSKAKTNGRPVMPQTDTGGTNPEDSKTAKPDKEGSALYNMTHGKVNPKVI